MARIILPTQRAAQPQNQAATETPEWADEKTITRLFGLTRTPLFNLRKAGKIRSISTAHGGATYGKRLFNVQSVRDFFEAQERNEGNSNKEGALV